MNDQLRHELQRSRDMSADIFWRPGSNERGRRATQYLKTAAPETASITQGQLRRRWNDPSCSSRCLADVGLLGPHLVLLLLEVLSSLEVHVRSS